MRRIVWALGSALLLAVAVVIALQLFAAAGLGWLLSLFGADAPTTEVVGAFFLWLVAGVLLPLAGAGLCAYQAVKASREG